MTNSIPTPARYLASLLLAILMVITSLPSQKTVSNDRVNIDSTAVQRIEHTLGYRLMPTQLAMPIQGALPDSVVAELWQGRLPGETGQQAARRLGIEEQVLWLARVTYTEIASDKLEEAEYVAWVIRNRVETQYRGKTTYRGVALDRAQFSAFNTRRGRAKFGNMSWALALDSTSRAYDIPRWRWSLITAFDVVLADSSERPFPITTRHYYRRHRVMRRINRHARTCRRLPYPHPAWEHDPNGSRVPVQGVHHTYFKDIR